MKEEHKSDFEKEFGTRSDYFNHRLGLFMEMDKWIADSESKLKQQVADLTEQLKETGDENIVLTNKAIKAINAYSVCSEQLKVKDERIEILEKEQKMQQDAMDWDRYKKNVAERVSSLTKENAAKDEEITKLKQQITNHTAINSLLAGDEPEVELANKVFQQSEQINQLKAEREEIVEALRGIMESCDPENTSHETIWRIAYSVMNKKP